MPSLEAYRRGLPGRYAPLKILTTTTVSSSTTTLIVSGLIDDEAPASTFGQLWVYITSGALAGSQRKLRQNPLDATTGTLTHPGDSDGVCAGCPLRPRS